MQQETEQPRDETAEFAEGDEDQEFVPPWLDACQNNARGVYFWLRNDTNERLWVQRAALQSGEWCAPVPGAPVAALRCCPADTRQVLPRFSLLAAD